MKVFITGIAGFAGSHLAELFLKDGEEVFGLVHDKKDCSNLTDPHFAGKPLGDSLSLYEGDICNSETLCKVIQEVQPDEIYHLAAVSNVPFSVSQPQLTFEINFNGTRNLFDAVIKSGQNPKILFVGSSDCYGSISPSDLPVREECPFKPVSPYSLSKAAADLLAYQYSKSFDLNIVRVRPFNHIGPRQATTFVCASFAEQVASIEAKISEPILYTGNLKAQKDFTDVRDMVRAYRLILKHGEKGEVFNICRGEAYSVEVILQKLIELSGVAIENRPDPKRFRAIDIPILVGDNSLLKSRTGWQATIPLEQSLEDLLDYHRSRLKNSGNS